MYTECATSLTTTELLRFRQYSLNGHICRVCRLKPVVLRMYFPRTFDLEAWRLIYRTIDFAVVHSLALTLLSLRATFLLGISSPDFLFWDHFHIYLLPHFAVASGQTVWPDWLRNVFYIDGLYKHWSNCFSRRAQPHLTCRCTSERYIRTVSRCQLTSGNTLLLWLFYWRLRKKYNLLEK